jgi:type IV secretory pathway VirB2 component (pilin)
MKTQRDPAAGKKTLAIIAVIVVGLSALGALSFQRSGLKISEVFQSESGASFGSRSSQPSELQ